MMSRSPKLNDAVLAEAGDWYALTLSDEITSADLQALEEWIAIDPSHQRAFEMTARTAMEFQQGALLGQFASLGAAAAESADVAEAGSPAAPNVVQLPSKDKIGSPELVANDQESDGTERSGWRSMLARPVVRWGVPSALAASLVFAVGIGSLDRAPGGKPAETAIAQTRVIILADGSKVTLGPASRIATSVNADERRVTLLSGEAFFEIAHDRGRPFWVDAGDARIQVVGTKFDVNRASGRVQVSVLDGVVKVHEPASMFAKTPVQILRASQRIEIQDSAPSLFSAPAAAPVVSDPVPAGDWRNGTRTYMDARLGDVVDDLNRYYGPGITLSDPGLADLRVAMELRPSDAEAFFDSLPLVAPVRVEKDRQGKVTVESVR
jgi:transmembrane sensor